jgi:hypothetical protein
MDSTPIEVDERWFCVTMIFGSQRFAKTVSLAILLFIFNANYAIQT